MPRIYLISEDDAQKVREVANRLYGTTVLFPGEGPEIAQTLWGVLSNLSIVSNLDSEGETEDADTTP